MRKWILLVLLIPGIVWAASNNVVTLYNEAAVTTDAYSDTKCLRSAEGELSFVLKATYNSGTPTLIVTPQHSADQITWFDLPAFTTVTTASSNQVLSMPTATTNILGCVRAKIDVGGTAPNYDVVVQLNYSRR